MRRKSPFLFTLIVLILLLALLNVLRWQAENREAPAGVILLLRQIETAVIINDQGGYLALLDHDDPEFIVEQTNWFKDRARLQLSRFRMELMEYTQTSPNQGIAQIKTTWARAGQKEEVFYTNSVVTHNGSGWKLGDFALESREFPRFVLKYPENLEKQVDSFSQAAAGAIDRIEQRFPPVKKERKIVIKAYPAVVPFIRSIKLTLPAWVGGWYEPGESIKLSPGMFAANPQQIDQVIGHEYTHYLVSILSKERATYWLQEGLATYFEDPNPAYQQNVIKKAKNLWDLPTLHETDLESLNLNDVEQYYAESYFLVRYIAENWGESRLFELLRALGNGLSWQDAISLITGQPWTDFANQWFEYLQTQKTAARTSPAAVFLFFLQGEKQFPIGHQFAVYPGLAPALADAAA